MWCGGTWQLTDLSVVCTSVVGLGFAFGGHRVLVETCVKFKVGLAALLTELDQGLECVRSARKPLF